MCHSLADERGLGAVSTLQECVLRDVNTRVGRQLLSGVQGLRESCLGTLRRCLQQLEDDCFNGGEEPSVTHALKKVTLWLGLRCLVQWFALSFLVIFILSHSKFS